MIDLRGLGLRLGLAATGGGSVVLAIGTDDLPTRLVAIAMAVVVLGPLVVLVLTDIGLRLGRGPSRDHDPAGPPTVGEWLIAAVFNGVVLLMVFAGVLSVPADSGQLLAASLVCAAMGLFLTAQLVARWWRNR